MRRKIVSADEAVAITRGLELIEVAPGIDVGRDILAHMEFAPMVVRDLSDRYYTHVSRYTTSAFMRLKLGEALEQRGVAPHIFETQREALDSARPWGR